ncbi:hydroxyacylglutathione hydrolase [Buchnera aphidicola (Mindarus keteleerifoliae)]|uniref:hydroxyacylglutathione hydrolase n=1 Tax=Buchnera aphidicola TaxID=9 RepID=UPI0031B687DB
MILYSNNLIKIKKIKILKDNYVWVIVNNQKLVIIVDPGESKFLILYLRKRNYIPVSVFLTHKHEDHIEGVFFLLKNFPKLKIYGPREIKMFKTIIYVDEKKRIDLLGIKWKILHTPGHTKEHVSYYSYPFLFCGDVLFSGGCGRVYKNFYEEQFTSIQKILSLPNEIFIYPSHEYTKKNLEFSSSLLKEDKNIINYLNKIKNFKKKIFCSLPTKLKLEKKINIFLRTKEKMLKTSIGLSKNSNDIDCFIKLRILRNSY